MKDNTPNPVGRPTSYTKEKGDEICSLVAEGMSLKSICLRDGMPDKSTFFRWLREYGELRDNYNTSIDQRTEAQHEMLLDMGDEALNDIQTVDFKASNAVVSAYKLKSDNFKWVMARMKPKKYGDKLDVMSDGKAIKGNVMVFADFKDETNS